MLCVCLCAQIEIGEDRKHLFIEQLKIDAAFLRDHGIMDYSLLLGISYASCSQGESAAFNTRFCWFFVALPLKPFQQTSIRHPRSVCERRAVSSVRQSRNRFFRRELRQFCADAELQVKNVWLCACMEDFVTRVWVFLSRSDPNICQDGMLQVDDDVRVLHSM